MTTHNNILNQFISKMCGKYHSHKIGKYYTGFKCYLCNPHIKTRTEQAIIRHINGNYHSVLKELSDLKEDHKLRQSQLNEMVDKTFLAADIPLKKLRLPEVQELFMWMKYDPPKEQTTRDLVRKLVEAKDEKIKQMIKGKSLYVTFDGSTKGKLHVFNIHIGLIEQPNENWLVEEIPSFTTESADICLEYIEKAFLKFGVSFDNGVSVIIADGVSYNMKIKRIIQQRYPHILFFTCFMHLLHNCANKIKAYYPDVNNLIASVKTITINSRQHDHFFSTIGIPPDVILTRFGTWLSGALYYYEHFDTIKTYFLEFYKVSLNGTNENVKIVKLKTALECTTIKNSLYECFSNYENLYVCIKNSLYDMFSVYDAWFAYKTIDFGADPAGISNYILRRLSSNDLKIYFDKLESKEPTVYEDPILRSPTTIDC